MSKNRSSKNKTKNTPPNIAIIVAVIGLIGTITAAYFAYRGPLAQIEVSARLTETAQANLLTSPTPVPPNPVVPTPTPLFATLEKSLIVNDDGKVDTLTSGVSVRNFRADATFTNPYSSSDGQWDIGFYFRNTHPATLVFVIASDKSWDLLGYDPTSGLVAESGTSTIIQSGKVNNLKEQQGETNILSLVVYETQACVYLNQAFVAQLDELPLINSGNISAMSGFWSSSHRESVDETLVKDFMIFGVDYFKCP